MLPSTQQPGILVGTDKIFLFLEKSDKTVLLSEIKNISSPYRLF